MSLTNLPTSGPEGTIPVQYAIDLTTNWRTYIKTSGQAFATHGFLIPIIAFQNILAYNPNAEGVRAYIGLDDATDPNSGKLVLVPVVDGKDVCYLPKSITGLGGDGDDDSNTYDITQPCPPICDCDSLLNEC